MVFHVVLGMQIFLHTLLSAQNIQPHPHSQKRRLFVIIQSPKLR
jgi:hypothetical protein